MKRGCSSEYVVGLGRTWIPRTPMFYLKHHKYLAMRDILRISDRVKGASKTLEFHVRPRFGMPSV